MKRESTLHEARFRHEKPPKVAGENSRAFCHFDRIARGRTRSTSTAFATTPTTTTKQKARKNSREVAVRAEGPWAFTNLHANNKKTTRPAIVDREEYKLRLRGLSVNTTLCWASVITLSLAPHRRAHDVVGGRRRPRCLFSLRDSQVRCLPPTSRNLRRR